MASLSSSDKDRRINVSINRLIAQHISPSANLTNEDVQARQKFYAEEIKAVFDQKPSSALAPDINHASDLIKRKLVQTNPGQALRFSNLYSRLLALPVLNQKWGILYLLNQLADSPDPQEDDPEAYEEYIAEERAERRQKLERGDRHITPEVSKLGANAIHPNVEDDFHPSGLRNVVPAPKQPPREEQMADETDPESMADSSGAAASSFGDMKRQMLREQQLQRDQREQQSRPQTRDIFIKSQLLSDNFTAIDPSEPTLLRDLPYTLQGLSSATLPFGKNYTLNLPRSLPTPLVSILNTLAEPSLLYRTLEDFVKTPDKGLLNQSLRAAISNELRAYLTLVATLEGQIRTALASIDDNAPRNGIGKAGVTLKRCVVWTREATMGLRLMSVIAEESKRKRGGQLISLIHAFSSSHGDPIVGAFAERLLTPVTRPFYDILRHWVYDGELSDPYREFFVHENTEEEMPKNKAGSSNVWEDKYRVVKEMIPSIITEEFAMKIFLIGKSLNFIHHSCGDAAWVESYSKESSKELRYGDTATLETWIDDAYKTTMRRLLHLMTSKFHVFEHIGALKSYILLGQGDFIALLMESLAANLDRPAGAQYRHTLTAQLEHAIRGSNAQYDNPEVLRRLDARMLQLSHGDIGWDCFTLEYKIDAPCDVIVSDWGNRQYLKVFNFLWRIKRVEFALGAVWRKVTTGSRGVLITKHTAVQQTWKTTQGVLAEMVHFVGQLQYYILFEVIEASWTELQAKLRQEDITLDDMIEAHTKYLNSITHKGLLGARRRRFAGGESAEDENSYMIQLGELLRTMLSYRECVDGLYSWSVSDFMQRQENDLITTSNVTQRRRGASGNQEEEIPGGPTSEFPVLQERLKHLGDRFRSKLQLLLGDLAYQSDVDLRFLGVSMNFNDVYQPVRRKAKGTPAAAPSAAAEKDRGGNGGGVEKSAKA
ncbi:Spc98 family-domain-containing protein [Apiospora rasikravindrae]|uniref:Spc98 family-domain-containing protein n=1 Tax=Apiospora rasikravindrae TaxID=990691 RepID=A0ABR1S239_9PEZI